MTIYKKVANASSIQLTNNTARFAGKNYADNDKIELFEDEMRIISNRQLCLTLWADDHTEFQHCFLSNAQLAFTAAKNIAPIELNNTVFIDTVLYGEGGDGEPETDDFKDDSLTVWFKTDSERNALKRKFFTGKKGKMVEVKFVTGTGDLLLEFSGIQDSTFWND